ncbi:hypothetical protein D3C87_1712600 [compost metagenome]
MFISCRITPIDWRYCHNPSDSGLSQMNFGNAWVKRASHVDPASSLLYSTLPPGCRIS